MSNLVLERFFKRFSKILEDFLEKFRKEKPVISYGGVTDTVVIQGKTLTGKRVSVLVDANGKVYVIVSMPEEGTITYFSKPATGDVKSPSEGKKLKILGWNFTSYADVNVELRYKTSGNLIAGIPGKGINAMAKSSLNRPLGDADEAVEIYLSATGNVKGWICTKEV